MFNRHYFIAAKVKGSDVHASAIISVRGVFPPNTEVFFEVSKRNLAEKCGLEVSDFVPVAFNRIK